MTPETPDLKTLATRLEARAERLADVEVQVRALVTSQKVEAREFLVQDERARIRARLEVQDYSPRLTFYDRLRKERLRIGLRGAGSPLMLGEGREIPLPKSLRACSDPPGGSVSA